MSLSGNGAEGLPFKIAFDNTLGALLVAGLLAMALWGIACVQTYHFFAQAPRDTPSFRTLIAFLLAWDTFDSALICHILYHYLVSNYLNPLALIHPTWSIMIHIIFTATSNLIIRSMLARRIYYLSKGNSLVTIWIISLSLGECIIGFIIAAKTFHIPLFVEFNKISTLFYASYGVATAADFSIAIALSYLLHKSRTGFQRTNSLIKAFMLHTVNTGLIVALDASAGLISYLTMPHNFVTLGCHFLLSKLYFNCCLALLNAREGLQEKFEGAPMSIDLSSILRFRGRFDDDTCLDAVAKGAADTSHTVVNDTDPRPQAF